MKMATRTASDRARRLLMVRIFSSLSFMIQKAFLVGLAGIRISLAKRSQDLK